MPTDTHCEPSGSLGTGELPVCNISAGTTTSVIPSGGVGHGNIRGICVWLTGFDVGFNTGAGIPPVLFGTGETQFMNSLVADGWIFLLVPSNEWFFYGYGSQGVYNDISNDSGFGSRYLGGMMHWWDHIVWYCNHQYPGMPITMFGESWGGLEVLQVTSNKSKTLLAAGCHVPATWLCNVNNLFTQPDTFGNINTSGLNVQTTALVGVTIPMIVGYGTADEAVGYAGTSAISNTFTPTAAASVTSLPLVSTTGYFVTVNVTVPTTGGAGFATYSIGSIGGGSLTGLTLVGGSGTVQPNSVVTQSTTSALIAAAGSNVTANPTGEIHEFTTADATTYANWYASTVDPLAPPMF